MSPCATSKEENYLEHPLEAFDYYRKNKVNRVICEEKHMGSRAVIVLCRDEAAARECFGIEDNSTGIIYTRTGRHFFDGAESRYETALLDRLRGNLDNSGFWDTFSTPWVCLDTELMPWSAKAQKLLADQYAPVGRAGRDGLAGAMEALQKIPILTTPENLSGAPASGKKEFANNMDITQTLNNFKYRRECLDLYTEAYRRYCWTVNSADDFRIAPFHILATEHKVWNEEDHVRHLSVIKEYITGMDSIFVPTRYIGIDLNDKHSVDAGIDWWTTLTQGGGEGMVVKPLDFIVRGKKTVLQPAVKCRGREYLRIIYGPEYTEKARMERLRSRSLHKKRRLALDEFSLGMEALERFVRGEPFFRVHECVFAILAMENEPVDPRL
jgi:protein phosphatase